MTSLPGHEGHEGYDGYVAHDRPLSHAVAWAGSPLSD